MREEKQPEKTEKREREREVPWGYSERGQHFEAENGVSGLFLLKGNVKGKAKREWTGAMSQHEADDAAAAVVVDDERLRWRYWYC